MSFGRKKKDKKHDPLAELRRIQPPSAGPVVSSFSTTLAQEDEAAALVGGRRHPGSGAFATIKSDASSERYQIEAKQTRHAQMTLKLEWLQKISYEAYGKGKVPFLHLRFLNAETGIEKDWIVLPSSEFKRLVAGGADL